jgi:hypothetical protein
MVASIVSDESVYQGTNDTLTTTVYQDDGVTPQNVNGWGGTFNVCAYEDQGTVFVTKAFSVVGDGSAGQLQAVLVPGDTANLFPGQYSFFWKRTDPGNVVIPSLGPFTLLTV